MVVGRSMNSRAPARMALTITCGWDMLPTAKIAASAHFLMDQLDGAQRQGVIVRGHIHQHDLGIGALHPAQDRICDHHRITGAGVHHARHAGAVHQHLQHGTLLAILGDDYD